MKFSYVYLLFFATTCLLQSMEIRVKSLKLDATLTINNKATVEDINPGFVYFSRRFPCPVKLYAK